MIRNIIAQSDAILEDKYSHYTNSSGNFADDTTQLFVTGNVDRFIQISSMRQMRDMQKRENKALLGAGLYHDQCSTLTKHIRSLEEEKEAVQYFWRNQVLEGQSRGGIMLKLSLEKKSN